MIINEEAYRESTNYLFDKLIPRIQSHVDKTGHIWNLNTSCHECLSVRQSYINNKYALEAHLLEKENFSFNDVEYIIAMKNAFNSEFVRKLSD